MKRGILIPPSLCLILLLSLGLVSHRVALQTSARLAPGPDPRPKTLSKTTCRDVFSPVNDNHVSSNVVEVSGHARLGNTLYAVVRLFSIAENECCNVRLPELMLGGWKPRISSFEYLAESCVFSPDVDSRPSPWCKPHDVDELLHREFFTDSRCAVSSLRRYFEINQTHVLGKRCPSTTYAALHIRSGDITSGKYNRLTGQYEASSSVHTKYWLYPTSYYAAVVRHIRSRSEEKKIVVLCETSTNPACGFFEKLADLDPRIEVRVGSDLLDDIHTLLCSDEVATSYGTFQVVLPLSQTISTWHTFVHGSGSGSDSPTVPEQLNGFPAVLRPLRMIDAERKSTSEVSYSFVNPDAQRLYASAMATWKNSAYQRHLVDARWEVEWTQTQV